MVLGHVHTCFIISTDILITSSTIFYCKTFVIIAQVFDTSCGGYESHACPFAKSVLQTHTSLPKMSTAQMSTWDKTYFCKITREKS